MLVTTSRRMAFLSVYWCVSSSSVFSDTTEVSSRWCDSAPSS
jgi:hypothetical protein